MVWYFIGKDILTFTYHAYVTILRSFPLNQYEHMSPKQDNSMVGKGQLCLMVSARYDAQSACKPDENLDENSSVTILTEKWQVSGKIFYNEHLSYTSTVNGFACSDRMVLFSVGLCVALLFLLLLGLVVWCLWRKKKTTKGQSQYEELPSAVSSAVSCSAPVILVSQSSTAMLVP